MNRQEAQELLPWFVAGTLSSEESRAVQAFIDSGEISKQEIDELSLFAETVVEQSVEEPAYNPEILSNVMAKLDDVPQVVVEEPLVVGEAGAKPSLWQSLSNWFEVKFAWAAMPPLTKGAVGAQFALVVALGAAVMGSPAEDAHTSRDSISETVSGPATAARAPDIQVLIAPGVAEADFRRMLNDANVTIVEGPSKLGKYGLAVEEGVEGAELEATIAKLKANPITAIVQAEPR